MKKLLLLSLLALFSAASVRADKDPRADYVTRVESCEAILREFMAKPETAIPASVLASAHAIVITNQIKAGFIFGVKDGYGVILVKQAGGRWSIPVLIGAGEVSFGFQIGANTSETILVITDDATPKMIFNRRFNVGVDAKAVAGPNAMLMPRRSTASCSPRRSSSTPRPAASMPAPRSSPAGSSATTRPTSASIRRRTRCPSCSTATG